MQMIDSFVDVEIKLASFRQLAHRVSSLPAPFRPTYFTVGERVRNKSASRVDDTERFSAFVEDHVSNVSGFDLIGERIRFGFFAGTRNARHEPTHIGCSVLLRGKQWTSVDLTQLLKQLCLTSGIERADACLRAEWNYRHLCIKKLAQFTIERTLGVDMSAFLPGLYWWTVLSDELAARHRLDVAELAALGGHSERWFTEDHTGLHAFRLYDSPDDWEREKGRVSGFLEAHPNFFSMTRIAGRIEAAESKEAFDEVTRPYWAGATPWESTPQYARD
jgi:hypothetical protein